MIIVTGTKRSGTSMWMQILAAAGFPVFGEAFPRQWETTLKDANPDGFYESILRQGIYYRTNPHPATGAFFHPSQVQRHVVKVFIPGLCRTDLAYIGKVIATVRHWREYQRSLERLYAMEDEAREKNRSGADQPVRMPPWLEWWEENFALLRDVVTRRYAIHVQSYDGLLADPEGVIGRVLQWLGDAKISVRDAVAAVRPENRTQRRPPVPEVSPAFAEIFDELYDSIHGGLGLSKTFIERLNTANAEIAPLVREHRQRVMEDVRRRRSPPPGGAGVDTEDVG